MDIDCILGLDRARCGDARDVSGGMPACVTIKGCKEAVGERVQEGVFPVAQFEKCLGEYDGISRIAVTIHHGIAIEWSTTQSSYCSWVDDTGTFPPHTWKGCVIGVNRNQLKALLPFWILALVIGSFLPGEAKRAIGTQATHEFDTQQDERLAHRLWHFGSFGLTTLLVSLVNKRMSRRAVWCAGVFVLGFGIEISQAVVFDTPMEWWDVRDDGYGVLAFTLLGEHRNVRKVIVKDN